MNRHGVDVGGGRSAVPEPDVKRALADVGVQVPRGATASTPAGLPAAAEGLRPPLVLKAWGPGLVHKSDVGAVRLGLGIADLEGAGAAMAAGLTAAGLTVAGFLVEEQQPAGLELIAGVVNRDDVGPAALLGFGGTWTEAIDRAVIRLCPLGNDDAAEMVDALMPPGRGRPVDRAAVAGVLLALAGADGLAARTGAELSELECNPVIASADGAVAVDARLIVRTEPVSPAPPPAAAPPFDRLFAPRAIGVVGASTTKLSFGNRFLRAYVRRGWTSGLYAIHPEASAVEGVPAVPTVADVPGGLDYLLVAVPAAACAGVVREAAGRVAFAQVMSGGFREAGGDGARLEEDLLRAARQSGVRVLGPNCMGVYSPAGRQTWQLRDPVEPGHVSVVSQSGGLAGDIIKGGEARGVRFSKLVTVGNAVDVTPGELVEYLVADADTEVIGLYLEGASPGLVAALGAVRGRKPVVALAGGLSRQGAAAAVSHTGGMAGDARVWEAVSRATGAAVVTTLEQLLDTLAYHQRWSGETAAGDGVLVIGPGGGASILAADACDRAGLALTPVADPTQQHLRALGYGAGTSVANPIEVGIGPASAADALDALVDPVVAAQAYGDVLAHFNVQSFYSQGEEGVSGLVAMLHHLAGRAWPARVAVVLRNLECAPPADAAQLRAAAARADLPLFTAFDQAAVAIRAAQLFAGGRR